ncbi:MAG: serine/threonine protein kinase [Pirellulaceae bacterium]|nr:serine/threonine protein kinase [Pirellulaceae bacterium]
MDAVRYARIRELFLETEDLPPDQHVAYLESKVGDDRQLIGEVLSLLAEHDAESARIEGERAKPVQPPIMTTNPVLPGAASDPAAGPAHKTDKQNTRKQKTKQQGPDKQKTSTSDSPSLDHTTRRSNRSISSEVTLHGAQRTHASPRYSQGTPHSGSQPRNSFWDQRTRRNRRLNSGWLWLAAVLPTALIGWWTYAQVAASQRAAIRNELSGLADTVTLSTEGFLNDKAQLVRSWSRQTVVRQSVIELVDLAKQDKPADALKTAPQSALIHSQLRELSGYEQVKFVIWDRAGTTLASWQEDRADVGTPIPPSGAANLARVMRGETVLFGPARLRDEDNGFVPETDEPVMANIVPIRNADEDVIAAMLVRGIDMYKDFDRMFLEISQTSGLDVYAVDRRGVMVTASPRASEAARVVELELQPNQFAAVLRVSDPGVALSPKNVGQVRRTALPLTYSVAGATTGHPDVRVDDYRNYCGVPVVGAWRWNERWQLGILVEHDSKTAFAPTRIVRFGFLLLATLLTITAFAAATQIAKQTSRAHAAIHPLSRYELISELGSGGMGVVYRARHRQLGRDTALKVLRGDRQNREDRLRFDREARLAASLSNPHSVMIYDYGRSEEGEAFCVMEFLKGITLYEVVTRSGHQSFGRVLFILRQICDALAEAHNLGLLHRDIKPQNVMLSLDPSVGDWAVVFDFGLAKPLKPDAGTYQTSETVWAGTPMYMAPERYREPGGMDPRSDIYSVGCIAYFLLSGRPPYMECDPESLFALVLSEQPIGIEIHRGELVPESITKIVNRCMAKNPEERFRTVEELSTVVDELRNEYPWTAEEARNWWRLHGDDA